MKICYLGGGLHTIRWLSYFAKRGHEVHLISIEPSRVDGVRVHQIKDEVISRHVGLGHDPFMAQVHEIRRIIQTIEPDILHSHFIPPYGYWGAMTDFHPFVVTPWGSDLYLNPFSSKMDHKLTKFALNQADLIVVECEDLKKKAFSFGVSNGRVVVIPGGVGVDLSQFHDGVSSDIRERLNLKDDPVVISVRSLEPKYNIGSIVNAIPLVLQEVPEAKFIFLGGGSLEGELRSQVHSLGLDGAVYFIGRVSCSDVLKYLVVSDIFVAVPVTDAVSISMLEAMACGVAPVVSDLPSKREWIVEDYNGYLIPIEFNLKGESWEAHMEIAPLVRAIVKLINDEDMRRRFTERNQRLIFERGDHYKNMGMVELLYEKLVPAKDRPLNATTQRLLFDNEKYWENRAKRCGLDSVGYLANSALHEYEEQFQEKAFFESVEIKPRMKVLDVGTGVGNWSIKFAQRGAEVTGIDFSPEMINLANKQAQRKRVKVKYLVRSADEMNPPPESFDLITSINVLMHITNEVKLRLAIRNMVGVLKEDGLIAILEYAPPKVDKEKMNAPHMNYKTYREWITLFQENGCQLIKERSVWFIGFKLMDLYTQWADRIYKRLHKNRKGDNYIQKRILPISKMIDNLLLKVPFVGYFSEVRVLVFQRETKEDQ